MNFQQLRHFLVTASSGNILKAAEILNITQSGLSRSIGALESALGLPLFERGPKGVKLTPFGEDLIPYAKRILHEQTRATENLKVFRQLGKGSLTIGIAHTFAYYITPEAISSVLRSWPGVQLTVINDNHQGLVDRMINGELDFAFSLYTEPTRHPDLDYQDLFTINTRVFARSDHEFAGLEAVTADQLATQSWGLINGASAEVAFLKYFQQRGITPPTVSMRCGSLALLVSVIQDTDLISLDSRLKLAVLNTDSIFGSAQCGLIYRKSMVELPIGKKLAEAICREAKFVAKSPP